MGLLSDPEYGSLRWVRILRRFHVLFSYLCYLGGVAWFLVLGFKEFNNETYFSENALLPGLATNEFNAEQSANQFLNELLQELQDKYADTGKIPVPWLVAKMSQLHLEVYTHNFTLNYPLGHGEVFKGTNVYGILRAPRTSSLEALVISVPYRALSSHLKGTTAGIALMLAFAQFARPQKYWAKDIIFLVTEHEQLGMQAWLEAYHGLGSEPGNFYSSLGSFHKPDLPTLDFWKLSGVPWLSEQGKCLDPGTLKGRSGSIQAAINLELHTPKIKYISVNVEGLNGQLPNLDLVNLVLKLCMKAGIHQSYKSSYSWMRNRHKGDDWNTAISTMLQMVYTQMAGVPSGNHGLFHRFGIEAVTLEGRDAKEISENPPKVNALASANFYRLGNALESIMRSMNNLLERFHQSYFFYILAATNRFISIGQYMPSLCLMCVALLIKALGMWVSLQNDPEDETDGQTKMADVKGDLKEVVKAQKNEGIDNEEASDEKLEEPEDKEIKVDAKIKKDKVTKNKEKVDAKDKIKKDKVKKEKFEFNFSIVRIGANYLLVHLVGYIIMSSPFTLCWFGTTHYETPTEQSVYYGLVVLNICIEVFTRYLLCVLSYDSVVEELLLTNILVLIELATALLAIGMHNYSLGLVLATIYTPVALFVEVVPDENSLAKLKQIGVVMVTNPLVVVTVAITGYAVFIFPDEGFIGWYERGLSATMQAVMFSVVDSMIYGNWLFNVVTLAIIPIWTLLWQIATANLRAEPIIPKVKLHQD